MWIFSLFFFLLIFISLLALDKEQYSYVQKIFLKCYHFANVANLDPNFLPSGSMSLHPRIRISFSVSWLDPIIAKTGWLVCSYPDPEPGQCRIHINCFNIWIRIQMKLFGRTRYLDTGRCWPEATHEKIKRNQKISGRLDLEKKPFFLFIYLTS